MKLKLMLIHDQISHTLRSWRKWDLLGLKIIVDGKAVGTWKRADNKRSVMIT